jgi:glycine betaine/proline transport system substrate-binding protein
MNQSLKRWLSAGALAAFAATSPAQAAAPESSDPIKLTQNDWTGQLINMTLMGEVLKSMGYNVEYVVADYLAQFAGLESGDLHIAMEIWETTAADALEASLASGNTVDLGETGMEAKEEWWYPLYMKERCPGLPNWEALLKCGEAFATAETAPKGRYLGGPVTWGGYDDERVEALSLPFEVVHAGTDAALFAEVQSAYERQAPIMAWIYAPHWATAKFEGEWVEFPTYERACYEDPAWGGNASMAYDCGKPFGWIKKVGWKGGEAKWPAAYKAVRAFAIDNATVSAMIVKVDIDGMTVEDVVKEWMAANQATWQAWTK